jgi:hypothetical protein
MCGTCRRGTSQLQQVSDELATGVAKMAEKFDAGVSGVQGLVQDIGYSAGWLVQTR